MRASHCPAEIAQQLNNKMLAYDIFRRQFSARPEPDTYCTLHHSIRSLAHYIHKHFLPMTVRDPRPQKWTKQLIHLMHNCAHIIHYISQFLTQLETVSPDHSILVTPAPYSAFLGAYNALQDVIRAIRRQLHPQMKTNQLSEKWVKLYKRAMRLYNHRNDQA